MNQEKIGKFIKDLRVKEGLTQEAFANMFGVTYQAVSKWENGKSIPDISILKSISKKFNVSIEELLEGYQTKKRNNIILILVICFITLCIVIGIVFYLNKDHQDFEGKTVNTTCSNFKISGNAVYNSDNTYISINNITYCGKEDTTVYSKIECNLYEEYNNNITLISSGKEGSNINLSNYLENLAIITDDYSACKNIKTSSLYLEINAYDGDDITTYKIPLTLEDNC